MTGSKDGKDNIFRHLCVDSAAASDLDAFASNKVHISARSLFMGFVVPWPSRNGRAAVVRAFSTEFSTSANVGSESSTGAV